MNNEPENVILSMPTDAPAYSISSTGIEFIEELDHEAWIDLGRKLGEAGRSIGFLIGDWLNYGEAKAKYGTYSHAEGGIYRDAIRITGLDYNTLSTYAGVARKVQFSMRIENLSFELHRKVAPLKEPEEQKKWLKVAQKQAEKGKPISGRRLAKSILLGRVAKDSDMSVPENDRGRDNVHPHVNRLVAFWGKMKRDGYLENADVELMKCMMVDISPVLKIYEELEARVAEIDSQSST